MFDWLLSGLLGSVLSDNIPHKFVNNVILLVIITSSIAFLYFFFLLNYKSIADFSGWGKVVLFGVLSLFSLWISSYLFLLAKREWINRNI